MIVCNKVEILSSIPDITIPQKPILRRMGYPADIKKLGKHIETMYIQLIKDTSALMEPAGSYIILKINQNNGKSITFNNTDFIINSSLVSKMLLDSYYVVIFLVTLGRKIEEKINNFINNHEMTRAFILDAIGSETTDEAANKLHHNIIKSKAAAEGFKVTPRFSSGYGWK